MNNRSNIKTLNVESYIEENTVPARQAGSLLREHFEKFFIVKVEELFMTMDLPVPPSKSTVHTVIYLTEGSATMDIGSETYTIYKNECFAVASGQVFSFGKHDVNKGYLISFQTDFTIGKFANKELMNDLEFLKIWGNPCIKLEKEQSAFVCELLKRIYSDYLKNGLNKTDEILPNFIALLSELNRAYQPISGSPQTSSVNITNQFKELVYKNIQTKHLVSEYASLLNITPNHLNKTVKSITGKSPSKWIDETILLEAKVLLYQSTLTISEIAEEVGFLDQSYFSRLFKKHEGMTPMEFRRMIEKS